ncbi:MAG: hypothetical protein KAX09_02155 [Candidatus Heimdallarchaeota archaeon]|nr:hypothetical protein [Candidatus Heimdallarchaeota archaeon]MCK4289764.1 hypothetical protein [Candidatus Heimdallarchaeota archaeon]
MVSKKTLSVTLLVLLSTLIFVQFSICAQSISKTYIPNGFKQNSVNPTFDQIHTNQFNESAEPITWFYLNIGVVILVPLVMIVQTIIDKTRKKPDVPKKLEEEEEEEEIEEIETRVEPSKFNPLLLRIGFFTLFIQNIMILPMLIIFMALALAINVGGPGGNPGLESATTNLFRAFSIVYYLDFTAAILCVVGLILFSLSIKEKVQGFVASGFWLLWIGVGIYPRINFVTSLGLFNPVPAGGDIFEFFLGFFGNTTFLLTCGYGLFALALFYTAKVLVSSGKLQRGGLLNAFGLVNFVIGAFASILLLLLLTWGSQMTIEAITSLSFILAAFWALKFLASPILGMVTGIITFNRIGKANKITN